MYDPPAAIRLGRQLEKPGVGFLETPVQPEDTAGCAAVAAALDLPVAVGECERSRSQFAALLQAGAADILQPDIGRAGITGGRQAVLLAEAHEKRLEDGHFVLPEGPGRSRWTGRRSSRTCKGFDPAEVNDTG